MISFYHILTHFVTYEAIQATNLILMVEKAVFRGKLSRRTIALNT